MCFLMCVPTSLHTINSSCSGYIYIHTLHYSPKQLPFSAFPPQSSQKMDTEMEKKNTELYIENCQMVHENEILRKKAEQLSQENQALRNELKQKLLEAASKQKSAQLKFSSSSVNK